MNSKIALIAVLCARAVFAEHKSEIPDLEDLDPSRGHPRQVQGVGV